MQREAGVTGGKRGATEKRWKWMKEELQYILIRGKNERWKKRENV